MGSDAQLASLQVGLGFSFVIRVGQYSVCYLCPDRLRFPTPRLSDTQTHSQNSLYQSSRQWPITWSRQIYTHLGLLALYRKQSWSPQRQAPSPHRFLMWENRAAPQPQPLVWKQCTCMRGAIVNFRGRPNASLIYLLARVNMRSRQHRASVSLRSYRPASSTDQVPCRNQCALRNRIFAYLVPRHGKIQSRQKQVSRWQATK